MTQTNKKPWDPKYGRMTWEEMEQVDLPVKLRDNCSHYAHAYLECTRANYHLPWRCGDERTKFQRCRYKNYLKIIRRSERLWQKEQKLRLMRDKLKEKIAELDAQN